MRKTRPPLRQRQAQATRDLIVASARELFLENGYTNTTLSAIAEQARVAVSTVYAAFGSKRAILRQIRLEWHHQTHIQEFLAGDQPDLAPVARLERLAQATRLQWQLGAQVIAIYRGAAAADREAAAELAGALQGRRKGLDAFTASLASSLRPGLDIQTASAILRSLCLVEVYEELVLRSGWTAEAYQSWLAAALKSELLATG
jgi:AcrR family transcriptional regulator